MRQFLKDYKIFSIIFSLALLLSARSLLCPLFGDELTYVEIADNILKGQYFADSHPTTVTPILPFVVAFFKIPYYAAVGLALCKLFNIAIALLGLRFCYLFLQKLNLNRSIILSIILLTVYNGTAMAWFSTIYPEALLFCCFWAFLYYLTSAYTLPNIRNVLLLLLLLALTRYIYAALGLLVLIHFYNISRKHRLNPKILVYCLLCAVPIVFWIKYVYLIESNNLSSLTYFTRYQSDSPITSNIMYGLGISQSPEVGRINGIPAFISLFVPITGLRNLWASVILMVCLAIGFHGNTAKYPIQILLGAVVLVMLGFIVAGTGFSRYWLTLLPAFYLGFYYLASKLKISDKKFVYLSHIIVVLYMVNEFRLTYLLLNKN